MVVSAKPGTSRWERGIKQPNEAKMAALRALLEREPGLSKAALCARTGVARSTLPYYLRHLRDDVAAATARSEDARRRVEMTAVDLVERVAGVAADVRAELAELRGAKAKNPAAIFGGFRTLLQAERLLAELVGDIAPPTQNTYVLQIGALLEQPVAPSTLSATSRAALGLEENVASE